MANLWDGYWCTWCQIKYTKDGRIYNPDIKNEDNVALLSCKNAVLTEKRFSFHDGKEVTTWLISDMTMAMVADNTYLGITFKDGRTKVFKLATLDSSTKTSAAGLILFGGVGSMIAGNMAIKNQIKSNIQQWASTINTLISKGKLPEMIFCKYCGTKNKSSDSICVHCGAILA